MNDHQNMASPMISQPRIVIVMHSVLNLKFFWVPILESMATEFDVVLYIRNDAPEILKQLDLPCRVVFIPIERQIAPWKDLRALFAIWRQLRLDQPDLLQTVTPKAGLLGMLAGRAAGVPIRVHTFQGQVWATASGLKRTIFRLIDTFIAQLSTTILADSRTQLDFLREEGVLRSSKCRVLGSGSISGVDLERFNHNMPEDPALRADLDLTDDAFVFLYVGRLQRDKGLHVLLTLTPTYSPVQRAPLAWSWSDRTRKTSVRRWRRSSGTLWCFDHTQADPRTTSGLRMLPCSRASAKASARPSSKRRPCGFPRWLRGSTASIAR